MEGKKYCSNCGEELKLDAKFCANCGADVKPAETPAPAEAEKTSFTDSIAKNNPFPALFKKSKEFLIKHKKPVIISASALAVIIIGIVLFNALWDFTKLEWDNEYPAVSMKYTAGRELELNVIAEDKEHNKIESVSFEVSGGDIEVDGTKATWTLPEDAGDYKITAIAPSGKRIEKTIKRIITKEEDYKNLGGLIQEEVDGEAADNDGDGLTNTDEKERGTNPNLADSDVDGLIDSYEIKESKTDPLKTDTDGDGLWDGDEIALGLNPLSETSKDDNVKDGDRELTYTFEENGITVEINGKGNIASSSVDITKNASLESVEGLLGDVYNFSTSGKLQNAKVVIKYDENKLREKGIKEEDLTLYYLNDETKELEKVTGTVNPSANTITVELKHFSKYILGGKTVESKVLAVNIMFVIDNSGSMYTEKQAHEAGYDNATGAVGNDANFKRLSLSKSMIEKMTGSFKFGVAEFSGNYVNLQKFTGDKESAKAAVEKMRMNWSTNTNGTNITEALKSGIKEFSDDKTAHYMILLTDGKDTYSKLSYSKSDIIKSAKQNNVKVCTIGLGSNVDTAILNEVSESTGCDYYNANDDKALDEIFNIIGADINFGYEDTNKDDKTDGMIMADSGFITTRDGFSFHNYTSEKSAEGHCYGMAAFAEARFIGTLPTKLSSRSVKYHIVKTMNADGYDLSDTYFAGSGSLYDYEFTTPMLKYVIQDRSVPDDYRDRVEDGTWMIKKEYYDEMDSLGFNLYIRDAKDNEKNDEIKKVQGAQLRENSEKLTKNAKADDAVLLDAIWRLFITQVSSDTKKTSFTADPDKAWALLKTKLESGDPTVIGINDNHAINAIKLVQDNNDSNVFKLAVYDNNYPGETRYIEIKRKKMNKLALSYTNWVNEYSYSFTYDGEALSAMSVSTISLQ